ncbi:hypothetical protein FNU79_07710 [Deinococcus detaillensis]|uniref:DUF3108 domain-containing protein n=1 Tax=Deinococcus detaillensis TaxID=2592048 RepID=A0A553V0T3_9DEIO|nr:hypothetical protein [Deinococcus detaillensis]TSA86069.1 hypothetical protein FNU79_07710 [Deinococcus detaillensis]
MLRFAFALLPFLALPALADPCDSGIKPMQPNWVWTYRDTDKDGVEFYEMRRVLTASGYTDTYTTSGKPPAPQSFKCDNGAQINITAPSIGGAEITKLVVTGVSFPAPANWKTGYAWQYVMNLQGRKSGFNAKAAITFDYRIVGREKISVAAGTFDAWKVEMNGNVDARVAVLPIRQKFSETQWIAEGVGIVKIVRANSSSELASLKKQ